MRNENANLKVAPPDTAAEILRGLGYPVSGKLLRKWYKMGVIPGVWTGKRVLLNIGRIVEYLSTGDAICATGEVVGGIRRIECN